MNSLLPVLLFGLAGVLAGGAWSIHRQGSGRGAIAVMVTLAVLALAGGILWLWPGGG